MLALHLPVSSLPDLRLMAETQRPYAIPDVRRNPDWVDVPEMRWVRSYAGAPICHQEQVIGFLCLFSTRPGFYDQHHAERLLAFADQAATAIRNARLFDAVVHHAAELEQRVAERTAELNQEKERVEAILNGSSDAILLATSDGTILRTNPAFERLLGPAKREQQASSLLAYVDPQQRAALQEALDAVVQDWQPRRLEVAMRRPDAAAFDADVALSPMTSGSATAGVVCSLRDITARKQVERQLRGNLEQEHELSQLKSRFITTVSHEFRTPLAVIQASTDLLKHYSDRLTEEHKQEEIEQIQTSIRRMVELIEDVLNLSRMQSGVFKFSPTRFDLVEFCRGLLRDFQAGVQTDHQLAFSVTGTGSVVEMDQKLLRYILGNLLSNAFKYSPPDSTVHLDLTLRDAQAAFHIRDEGIGIPEADLPRLFDAFYRSENAETVPGSGLGLTIVKQAVDLQGGTITVESAVGTGTTFTVIFPTVSDQMQEEEPGIY
jgi:PAS domain S-box-containing protein